MASLLVIEDDDDLRFLLRVTLEMAGHRVLDAPDGAQGLAVAVAEHGVDCVLVDLALGDLDGLDVLERLRARDPERRTRLVALTGHAGEAHRRRSLAAGADLHLLKPLTPDELVSALAQLLAAPSGD